MTILTMPAVPAFAASRFGLVSNTQTFHSPLSGQTQSVERPGARWRAEYRLPPMKRAQAAAWQTFLLQLRGGAGRFYACDPDARIPRGSAGVGAVSSRNEIRNGNALGAVTGIIGSGGAAPANWGFGPANGLTREIIGSGVEAGISYVEVRFSGTPTGNYALLSYETPTQIAVAEGEAMTTSCYVRMTGGSGANIVFQQRAEQLQAGGASVSSYFGATGTVDGTWRRVVHSRTILNTTPDTARLRPGFYLSLTVGQPVDVTLRLGNAQFEKAAAPSAYIPTTGSARSRDAGARVDGAAQSGTTLKTWNWTPAQAACLRAGDYIAIDDGTSRSLHLLTADAASDADGRAVLALEPPLRNPPADNAAVIVTDPACIMALAEDEVVWEAGAQGIVRLSFAAEERF